MNNDLAYYGGNPIREEFLPYGRQAIDDDDIKAVVEVLKGDYLTTGPFVKKFEDAIKEYTGAQYAVAVSNGTAALHAACFAAGIKEGDEVITTPLTFAASANCVLYCGGTPVFADIDSETMLIDLSDIERKITDKTKAIIVVDYTGCVCDYDKIIDLAKKHNLVIIEDAAHSLGSRYKEKYVGSFADITTFSFHPVKHITTGEGGMITTNNPVFYERLKLFRTHGITRDRELLKEGIHQSYYYEQLELGFNYRITDIQCALGLSQLDKIDKFVEKRKELVAEYNRLLKGNEYIILPIEKEYSHSSWHLFVIRLKNDKIRCDRDEFFKYMLSENIGVNVHYIPVYHHPYYKSLGYNTGLCPVCEEIFQEIITLPLFPSMNCDDVNNVVEALNKVIKYFISK